MTRRPSARLVLGAGLILAAGLALVHGDAAGDPCRAPAVRAAAIARQRPRTRDQPRPAGEAPVSAGQVADIR